MLLGWLAAACRCSVALAASAMQFPACLAAASAVLAPHRLICSSISYKYNNSQCYHGAVRTCHVSTLHLQNHDICCLRPPPFRVTVPPHCTVWRIGRLQMAEPQICRRLGAVPTITIDFLGLPVPPQMHLSPTLSNRQALPDE